MTLSLRSSNEQEKVVFSPRSPLLPAYSNCRAGISATRLTPLRLEGKPVWIGQISRDIGVHLTAKTIATHIIDPNVDETREFLVEDLACAQALPKLAHIGGVGVAPYDQPRGNLTGDPYFSDGKLLVLWLSGEPTSSSEIEIIDQSPYAQVEQ